MDNRWMTVTPHMGLSKNLLIDIASGIPKEHRPPSYYDQAKPKKTDLIEIIKEAKSKFYDLPPSSRQKAKPKAASGGVTASEVNEMLRGFPPFEGVGDARF